MTWRDSHDRPSKIHTHRILRKVWNDISGVSRRGRKGVCVCGGELYVFLIRSLYYLFHCFQWTHANFIILEHLTTDWKNIQIWKTFVWYEYIIISLKPIINLVPKSRKNIILHKPWVFSATNIQNMFNLWVILQKNLYL